MSNTFNNRLRQVLLLALIISILLLLFREMYIFLPGLLGGVTLFILTRALYYKLTEIKHWKKGGTALLFILGCLVIIAIPVFFSIELISPKIKSLISNEEQVISDLKAVSDKISQRTGFELLSAENIKTLTKNVSSLIPKLINSTASVLTNLLMMFFLYYYLLTSGRRVENFLNHIIPLKPKNIESLAHETNLMIRANALGIPIICIVQGIFAAIGYLIFGVKDWAMWGFITGVFAFFPLVGTMIIWVPLVIALYASGVNLPATGLTIYSIVVTGNVDYITRLGLLKKMGNVHPLITVLGVIAGLGLFGFMGLIFGPLLVSYLIILVKIYQNEFTSNDDIEGIPDSSRID